MVIFFRLFRRRIFISELYKKIPQMFGHGITGWANLDDFFPVENFRDIKEFPNKVPFLTGLNSTEGCCLFPINLNRTMMPGIYDGWTVLVKFYIKTIDVCYVIRQNLFDKFSIRSQSLRNHDNCVTLDYTLSNCFRFFGFFNISKY